jgi:hypothetical protein
MRVLLKNYILGTTIFVKMGLKVSFSFILSQMISSFETIDLKKEEEHDGIVLVITSLITPLFFVNVSNKYF